MPMTDDVLPPADFTEGAYRALLELAVERFAFITFPEHATAPAPCALWRHDMDVSPQRALALARIEADVGVTATYFLHLHSDFYSALETEVAQIVDGLLELGHALGLHFDPAHYAARGMEAEAFLEAECDFIGTYFGRTPEVFSIHNPTLTGWEENADDVAGMVNASSAAIAERFTYCSDSNGVWRFTPLHDVLAEGARDRIHVLTHAEWWTSDYLMPRDRIQRAVAGRALSTERRYDAALAIGGRPNLRG
jgi:hypothetical protein